MNWFHYFLLVNYQLVLSVGAQFIFREDPLGELLFSFYFIFFFEIFNCDVMRKYWENSRLTFLAPLTKGQIFDNSIFRPKTGRN